MKTIERLFLPLDWINYFENSLKRAGFKKNLSYLMKLFLISDFFISIILLFLLKDLFQYYKSANIFLSFMSYYIITFFVVFAVLIVVLYSWISYTKSVRRNEIENVLGDYFQLVAANVGAGMTIDQALLYAVKGRFRRLSEAN